MKEKIKRLFYTKRYFIKLSAIYIIISLSLILLISLVFNNIYTSISKNYIYEQEKSKSEQIAISIEMLMHEYTSLTDKLAFNPDIQQFLESTDSTTSQADAKIAIEEFFLNKKGEEEIHLISSQGANTLSTGYIPNIYQYKNWGILYDLNTLDNDTIYFSSQYRGLSGDAFSLSVATKVQNRANEVIGYVIIDVYRNKIQSLLSNYQTLQSMIKITDNRNLVVYSNGDRYEEGSLYVPIEENDYIYTFSIPILNNSFTLHYEVKNTFLLQIKSIVTNQLFWLIFFSIIVSMITALIISSGLRKPINKLIETMKVVGKGDLDAQIDLNKRNDLHELQEEFNKLVKKLKNLQEENIENQHLMHEAQIAFLQAQIKPHFLYNMLATIKGMISYSSPDEVKQAIVTLTKLLRNSFDFSQELRTLKEHLAIIECYVEMQNYRFSNRFTLQIEATSQAMRTRMPPLLIQPIVENSIIHGFSEKEEDCLIHIKAHTEDDYLIITIFDNGEGMEQEKIDQIMRLEPTQNCSHVGLANIIKRIKYFYDDNCSISIHSSVGEGTTVTCVLKRL